MTKTLKILAAQLNPVVGDISGNHDLARASLERGKDGGADLVVLSEFFMLGYPAEDLVLKPSAVEQCMAAVKRLAELTATGPALIVGSPWSDGSKLYNSALFLADGKILARYDKRHLPNYGVFDEKRLFDAGEGEHIAYPYRGVNVGIAICEDLWFEDVPRAIKAAGADLLIAPNASPWRRSIQEERARAFDAWSDAGLPYLFVNQVGGQDELVFDGASYATNTTHGERCGLVGQFETGDAEVSFDAEAAEFVGLGKTSAPDRSGWESEYSAAVLGLGDYVNKNGFKGVVLGMSGGIDSALTAAIAVDALGADRVWCVMMPSRYTSDHSLEDAKACSEALGVRYDSINIAPGVDALGEMLDAQFAETQADTTEENIQSRLRGLTLMALSNKFGHMVLTTGNKSEMAVGYATLYGDMCGGYNALKDFYKTEVFELAKWRNTSVPTGGMGPSGEVIPTRIITKPPSAELRDDQRDDDSLPPYDVLDDILRGLVDQEADIDELLARGHDEAVVRRIEHLLYIAEYKRRQAPPGVKVGSKNFGRDRRYPITNRFRDD
ncbi:MAG: NAD+ synthase [Hyphomonadaceae bacterium]